MQISAAYSFSSCFCLEGHERPNGAGKQREGVKDNGTQKETPLIVSTVQGGLFLHFPPNKQIF